MNEKGGRSVWRWESKLVDGFVGLVTAHFANGVFEVRVLTEQVVFGHFVLRVVVLRAFEEEAQEALRAVAAIARGGVDEDTRSKQRGAAKMESRQRKLILICMG